METMAPAIPDLWNVHKRQCELTAAWHVRPPVEVVADGFGGLFEANHLRNFLLWHEEDRARRDDQGPEFVYTAKRAIDRYNQERNNFIEKMDRWLVEALQPLRDGVSFNSETPGMIIDRLSILSLKEYHMEEESHRAGAPLEQREACQRKLAVIRNQQADLQQAAAELLADVVARRRSFKVYFQFKMYNDPALNPQLYSQSRGG
jgi:hypothetical protein